MSDRKLVGVEFLRGYMTDADVSILAKSGFLLTFIEENMEVFAGTTVFGFTFRNVADFKGFSEMDHKVAQEFILDHCLFDAECFDSMIVKLKRDLGIVDDMKENAAMYGNEEESMDKDLISGAPALEEELQEKLRKMDEEAEAQRKKDLERLAPKENAIVTYFKKKWADAEGRAERDERYPFLVAYLEKIDEVMSEGNLNLLYIQMKSTFNAMQHLYGPWGHMKPEFFEAVMERTQDWNQAIIFMVKATCSKDFYLMFKEVAEGAMVAVRESLNPTIMVQNMDMNELIEIQAQFYSTVFAGLYLHSLRKYGQWKGFNVPELAKGLVTLYLTMEDYIADRG